MNRSSGASGESGMRKLWRRLAQTAAWLCALLATFVFPPPTDITSDPSRVFVFFSRFIVAILVGLLTLPLGKFAAKRYAVWRLVSIALLAAGITSFFGYEDLRSKYTADYQGDQRVIGWTFTYEGWIHKDSEKGITNKQLLADALGDPAGIWTAESIHKASLWIHLYYLLTVITLAACVITLVQALNSEETNGALTAPVEPLQRT